MNQIPRVLLRSLLFSSILVFLAFIGCKQKEDSVGKSEKNSSTDLRERVRRIVLDNGMTFLLLKREGAPFFAAEIRVRVGGIEEDAGMSGLAHFFEHMAFKGTDTIGTTNFGEENKLLELVLAKGTELTQAKKDKKGKEEITRLEKELQELTTKQNAFIAKNEFVEIFHKNGGTNLNATTSSDFTTYYVSLPSSRLELWAYMESERLGKRVLREFFSERDVVAEERRMRYDNAPEGRLYEALMDRAFDKSPYKTIPIGKAEHIQIYTPEAALNFYKKYYIPSRMVGAIVGNIDLDLAEKTVRSYFSKLPKVEDPKETFPTEVFDATYPRTVQIKGPDKPRFYLAYHRVANPHPDDEVFDVIQAIMCEGKTSRLYRKLVLEEKRVAAVDCFSSLPGARLDSLFGFFGMPLEGYSNRDIEKIIIAEIERLAKEGPTADELEIVKNNIDAELIYSMESNEGMASKLSFYEVLTGDWKYIYHFQKRVHEISPDDVKNVLRKYFVAQRQVSAYLEQEK